MDWPTHFQALSGGGEPTASFGAGYSDVGLEVPEEVKTYGIPIGTGIVVALIAKVAGISGIVPAIIGLGAAGAMFAITKGAQPSESSVNPSLTSAPAPAPQAVVQHPYVAPAPRPATAPPTPKGPSGSPWPVLATLSRDGAVLSVADVQNALNVAGFASPYLVVDGKAGNQTAMAVKRAQAKFGLTQTGLTTDGNLKVKLQNAVADKAGAAAADAASDALVAEMKAKGYV